MNPFEGWVVDGGQIGRAATDAEAQAMLRHADALFKPVICLLRWTGLRPWQIRELRWADVNLGEATLRTYYQNRRRLIVPLAPVAVRLLRWLLNHQPAESDGRVYVFVNRKSGQWSKHALFNRLKLLRDKCGLPDDVRLYGKGLGTRAVINGVEVQVRYVAKIEKPDTPAEPVVRRRLRALVSKGGAA
jgi:integrase